MIKILGTLVTQIQQQSDENFPLCLSPPLSLKATHEVPWGHPGLGTAAPECLLGTEKRDIAVLPTRDLAVGQTEGDPEMRPAPWFGRREAGFQRTTACLRVWWGEDLMSRRQTESSCSRACSRKMENRRRHLLGVGEAVQRWDRKASARAGLFGVCVKK